MRSGFYPIPFYPINYNDFPSTPSLFLLSLNIFASVAERDKISLAAAAPRERKRETEREINNFYTFIFLCYQKKIGISLLYSRRGESLYMEGTRGGS